jgi:hypothetical protein
MHGLHVLWQGKKRFKSSPILKCNATKWFIKLQEKHNLKKYTHVQKRRTQGKIGLPTYDSQLEKISLLGRQQHPHGYHNFATSFPSLGDKIREGTMNTKPITFLLSSTSTTFSSIAYLLSTTRNSVICNHHVCNWDATTGRMQLCRVFYATAMDFCPLFGCVCNYGATMITFIPTFGWFLWIYTIVYIWYAYTHSCMCNQKKANYGLLVN